MGGTPGGTRGGSRRGPRKEPGSFVELSLTDLSSRDSDKQLQAPLSFEDLS